MKIGILSVADLRQPVQSVAGPGIPWSPQFLLPRQTRPHELQFHSSCWYSDLHTCMHRHSMDPSGKQP